MDPMGTTYHPTSIVYGQHACSWGSLGTKAEWHMGFYTALMSLIVLLGLVYFIVMVGLGVYNGRPERFTELTRHRTHPISAVRRYHVYCLIACLNEEAVIGQTVRSLAVRFPRVRVIVIDDGSADRTSEVARSVSDGQLLIARRELPHARLGKGPALNAGFDLLLGEVRRRRIDPAAVVVCVLDADGRLSHSALDHVLPLFDDPGVGGVQLAVRIRNRHKLIGRLQDFEFWGLSATFQLGRLSTQTVSLGGNGQFTRLSALVGIHRDPWSQSLTEDLDLAITLAVQGWALTTTPHAWVEQEGLESWRRLVRQRTRWSQGHMTAGARLPEIWRSRKLRPGAMLELTMYLLIPWVLGLSWSICFHLSLATMVWPGGHGSGQILTSEDPAWFALSLVMWYLVTFFPNVIAGYLYFRRNRDYGWGRSFALGHLLPLYNYISYLSAWRAVGRILRGRTNWDKTPRVGDRTPTSPTSPASPPRVFRGSRQR